MEDPAKIITTEFTKTECRECHATEYEVWRKTTHATGFKNLHRNKTATAIAKKMGFRLLKRDSLCLKCHYTAVQVEDQLRAVSGVSCESCHGAGRDWINVHNNYGGKGFNYENETPENKLTRIEQSRALGMRRPSDLYSVAAVCYQCHFVPEEKLVNVGSHTSGPSEFDYLEKSQGVIRHNFLQSYLTADGRTNAERPLETKRLMFVLGRALALEYSLRGMAVAKQEGRYAKAKERQVTRAVRNLKRIYDRLPSLDIESMLGQVREVNVIPNNQDNLMRAADAVGAATRAFLAKHDGSELAVLDALFTDTGVEEVALSDEEEGAGGGATSTVATVEGAPPTTSGEVRNRLRPSSTHATIGPSRCVSCHESQETWWLEDAHYQTANPFWDEHPKNVEIARNYGLSAAQMQKGDGLCMDCHGTVITGREGRTVNDGVGCESCHGPGKDYLKPHQEGEKSLGDKRPGYVQALGLGMLPLRKLDVRAKTCTDCHYITDEKLLAAGHPSGQDHDYVKGMASVKHWQRPLNAAATLKSAFDRVLQTRGPVPEVQVAVLTGENEPDAPDSGRPSAPPTTGSGDRTTSQTTPSAGATASKPKPQKSLGAPPTRVHPPSPFQTIGPGKCLSCHETQEAWWVKDPHGLSLEPFFDEEEANVKIARLFGIKTSQMLKGNQICMDCHGTIVSGKERRDANDAVGCESCHGPGKSFLKPHQEGEKSLGEARPGYIQALELGMMKLRDLDTRAGVCASCHHVTEPRLISAGHPTGKDFDYIGGMAKIKHWERPLAASSQLAAAFTKVLGADFVPPATQTATTSGQTASRPSSGNSVSTTPSESGQQEQPKPSELGLPPFPEVAPNAPLEEILLLLKQRLERLHQAVHAKEGGRP